MDPELKRELEEMRALVKDNHRMLRAIRRDQWLGFIGKIIFWALIVIVPYYVYQQYLQPIITKLSPTTPAGTSTTASPELQKLLNFVQAGG